VDSGYVNPDNLMFNTNYIYKIKQVTGVKLRQYDNYVEKEAGLIFAEQPFQQSPDFVNYISGLLNSNEFKEIFNFN
jgi:hypothetical protein